MRTLSLTFSTLAMTLLLAACHPDLLRYGNRSNCLGFVSQPAGLSTYQFPITAYSAKIEWLWVPSQTAFVLRDRGGVLHLVRPSGDDVAIAQINDSPMWGPIAVSNTYDLVSVSEGVSASSMIRVYSLDDELPAGSVGTLNRTNSPTWHPNDRLLAGVYFPEGYTHASNVIGIFDLRGREPVLTRTYELGYTALGQIFGWSTTGEVIAVSQDSTIGQLPYYVFSEDANVADSLFKTGLYNCVYDGQWSPIEQTFAFVAYKDSLAGSDIFLETVARDRTEVGSLVNLTNSPEEYEIRAAWSENGRQIAYSKAYLEPSGRMRQELFLVDLDDEAHKPVQLTDTPGEYATEPLWLSDHEIGYLSWSSADRGWALFTLSTDLAHPRHRRIMDIPQSWYE